MSSDPTNITRLEVELYKHGFRDNGFVTQFHPDANDEGHKWYPAYMSMGFDKQPDLSRKTRFEFYDRYSEKAVTMVGSVPVERLRAFCDAMEANHKRSNNIYIEVIVSVRTAVAVCEALRSHG